MDESTIVDLEFVQIEFGRLDGAHSPARKGYE
jgi:hypothetical protein